MMRVGDSPLGDGGGSAGGTSTPIHACGLFFTVTATSGKSVKKCYMTETQLMWLKRWKNFTVSRVVSRERKGKI